MANPYRFAQLSKSLLLIATLLFICQPLFAQTENYLLKDVGYISIPAEMEIQSGNYKKLSEAFGKKMGKQFGFEITDNRVVFQQRGLNNGGESALATYARVIIETDIGNPGDYDKLTTKQNASATELQQAGTQMRAQIEQGMAGTGLRLVTWNGLFIATVNGRSALKISYVRQLRDQPFVVVNMYTFQNNDRMHRLTMSYRQQDASKWQPLYAAILKMFTITNVR